MKHEVTVELAGGKKISFETGSWAKQAHGSAVVRSGENVVLATACANPEPREGIDFFPHTVGAVRVGQIEGKFIINPTYEEMGQSTLNIMVVGTSQGIVMIEAGAREATEDTVVDAIEFGHGEIKKICSAISHLAGLVENK